MRRPISSKPDTCTESMDVYAAGISGKVARITRGDLSSCHVLPARYRVEMGEQKSAEAMVVDLELFTFEMLVQQLAKPAYKHFAARMCGQILAEHLNYFKVKML